MYNFNKYEIYNSSSYGLENLKDNSIDAVITDPPYGISYQNNYWDKALPNKEIWEDSLRVVKPGGYCAIFSSVRLMHRLMVNIEDCGFIIKDVMFWTYLNGMPKSRNIALDIDKVLGVKSLIKGQYKYVQGYRVNSTDNYKNKDAKDILEPLSPLGIMYKGSGLGIKPAYEPIILVQKPLEEGLTVAQNIIKYGTGGLNIEQARIPYEENEGKIGHNPHNKGRVPSNIIRTEAFYDGYDKFFLVPKVRQGADSFNNHPTLKPVELMNHLVKLLSWEDQVVLDPFMGSGSTGVSCLTLNRRFKGYELDIDYFNIAMRRLQMIYEQK